MVMHHNMVLADRGPKIESHCHPLSKRIFMCLTHNKKEAGPQVRGDVDNIISK